MKIPVNKKFFDMVKSGEKTEEYWNAHLTLVCTETGETLRKEVKAVSMMDKSDLPDKLKQEDFFEDEKIMKFELEK